MVRSFLLIPLFFVAHAASAHVPYIVVPESSRDVNTIEDPELSRAFYGQMNGFPHTYEIRATESFLLHVEVLMPDISSSNNNVSGIIIKERGEGERVQVVGRMPAKEASWETEYEPFGADTYRIGGSFEEMVDPGVYRIEVSTPDNLEKYVLVVGKREEFGEITYLETVARIAEVKAFFEKSRIRVLESPLVYVPILFLVLIISAVLYSRRKRRETASPV